MKPIGNPCAGPWRTAHLCLLLLGALLAGSMTPITSRAADDKDKEKDKTAAAFEPAPGDYNNSVTLGLGSYFVGGDQAQFMRRNQSSSGVIGGIEDFHFEQQAGKKGLFQLDGHALLNNHDYEVKFNLSQDDLGYLRAGYREFRTWYDGSGGYSTRSNVWVELYPDALSLDRREAWIEGGLTVPDWPTFTFRYAHETREGKKDSTIWGDYNLTPTATTAVSRGLLPAFLGIDESRHLFEADLKHTFGRTDAGIGMRYDAADIENSRNILRRLNEPKVVRAVTQTEQVDADLLNARGSTETRFNNKVLLTTGYSFTRLDTDIGGSRIFGPVYGSPFSPTYANRQRNDEGYFDLGGGSRSDQYVVNVNLMLTPSDNVVIVPSLRLEHQEQYGIAVFTETVVTNAATPAVLEGLQNVRNRDFTDVSQGLDFRFTGFTNWVLYARGEWLEGQGNLRERETERDDDTLVDLARTTDSDRWVQKYSVGANWYPLRQANFAAQYYLKMRQNEYDHLVDTAFYRPPTTNNLYPAFIKEHGFDTHDINFRTTWRPLANVTLVSRYDFQVSTIETRGDINNMGVKLGAVESAEATTHIFSQSISWSPLARLYLQGNISYVMDRTTTPAADIKGAATRLTQNADNEYWNATVTTGVVMSDKTDLQAQYYYYRADDFSDNSSVSVPYGADAEQHGVTVTYLHRIRKNLHWRLQYGYFKGTDAMAGGHNNYDAHLVYSSMQYLF